MRIFIIILIVIFLLAIVGIIGGRIYNSNVPAPKGVGNGTLAPCPKSPNCVSTLESDDLHKVDPIPLNQEPQAALTMLVTILMESPKTRVITKTDRYLHVEMRSRLWNFIDDVEFVIDGENGLIQSRSAARMGYSDLGVNKSRYEGLKAEYEKRSP